MGLLMTILALARHTAELKEGFLATKICAYIAEHVGLDAECIGVDSHFKDDLGLDWLDVVELTILIEEQFTAEEGTDEADQLELVSDLIRHIEGRSLGRKLMGLETSITSVR
jgi:acyl carrier protein